VALCHVAPGPHPKRVRGRELQQGSQAGGGARVRLEVHVEGLPGRILGDRRQGRS